ncbi:MAG: pilus assembly protein PilP [Wenzhouxiangella sp.]
MNALTVGRLALVSVAALMLTTGCERDTRDLQQWVQQTLRTPGGEIDPIPPIRAPETVVYDAFDLRDPFQRRVARAEEEEATGAEEGAVSGVRPDFDRAREFLEGFPLDTLRMVGTLEMEGVNFALIRDTERVVHRVSEGAFMGTNHGRVTRVRDDRVELVELFEDPRGGWVERRTQVMLTEN